MNPSSLDLQLDDHGSVLVVSFSDSILMGPVVMQRVEQALLTVLQTHLHPVILFDFSGIQVLSSKMLGLLIATHNRLKETNRRVVLCGMSPRVEHIFGTTRLQDLLPIYPDRQRALEQHVSS